MEDGLVYNTTNNHVCQANKSGNAKLNCLDKVMFKCGGCREELRTICQLHEHLLKEFLLGSYLYNHTIRTAFPVHKSVSKETQTEFLIPVTEDPIPNTENQYSRKLNDGNDSESQTEILVKKESLTPCDSLNDVEQENKCKNSRIKSKRKSLKRKKETSLRESVGKKARTRKNKLCKIENGIDLKEVNNDDLLDKEAELIEDEQDVNDEVLDSNYEESTDNNYDNLDDPDFVVNGHSEDENISIKKRNKRIKKKISPSSKNNKTKSGKLKKYVKPQQELKYELIGASDQDNEREYTPDNDLENDFDEQPDEHPNKECIKKKRGRPKSKTEKFTCEHCDTVFSSEKLCNIHLYTVHKLIYPFSCKQCHFKTFTNIDDFNEHRDQHPKQVYICELCGKELKSREGLKLHEYIHSGEKPYCCDQCDYRGRTSTQLRQHMFTHMDSKTEQCELCGKSFFTKGKLKEHLRYCRKEFNHHCPHCQKGFPTASGLRKHVLMHTGEREFVCDVCGFATFRITLLNSHMRTHTGEKPHKCKECGAKLATRGTLLLHLRTHTHEKPFVCTYCSKAFTSKWNLKTHLRQHTGETPYKCDICGQGFKQNVLRKAHMRSHLECTSIEQDTITTTNELSTEFQPNIDHDTDKEHHLQSHMDMIATGEPGNVAVDDRNMEPDKIHLTNFMYDRSIDGDILNQGLSSEKMHPLDLKLQYSCGSDLKNVYDNTVINSHQLQSTTFNLINYPDLKHV